jgi:uncharacterized DUF497 family protein
VYTWNDEKNRENKRKHGFHFSEITGVFEDPHLIERYDREHSSRNEDRYICLGSLKGTVILYVVITLKGEEVRIISARKAEPLEEKIYYEHYKRETEGN